MNIETVNWPKIVLLLVLTLLAMRLFSWGLAWVLRRVFRVQPGTSAIASNVIAFTAFTLWLYLDLEPREPLDWSAIIFGAVVYLVFLAFDTWWLRRKAARAQSSVLQSPRSARSP